MARMARYAVLNLPVFDDIVKTQSYRLHRSIDQQDTLVTNTAASYLKIFPGADGIKTGYISQAGHCFVGSATRGGWRLIAVALDSSKCREDVMGMLSYGFAHFQQHLVAPAGTPEGNSASARRRDARAGQHAPRLVTTSCLLPLPPTRRVVNYTSK